MSTHSPAARSSKNSAVETRLHPRPADAEPEEEAPYEDDDTEMNPAMLASPKTRITRTPKVKTTRAGRPSLVGLDHLHHGGSDGVQTSRCTLCNLIFYNAPPFAASSWLRIVYETIRMLHDEGNPHRKYFHYKHDICSFIDRNWAKLCPDKKRTLTWNNTVSAVITTHRKLFKSNPRQAGFWTLLPPPGMASTVAELDSDEENVDYVERAKNFKAAHKAGKNKKRKLDEMTTTLKSPSAPVTPAKTAPSTYFKAYYTDGPSPKLKKSLLADLHLPKPFNWKSPAPLFIPDAEEIYLPVSVRRRTRPPISPYFARVHVKLQATADKKVIAEAHTQQLVAQHHLSSTSPKPSSADVVYGYGGVPIGTFVPISASPVPPPAIHPLTPSSTPNGVTGYNTRSSPHHSTPDGHTKTPQSSNSRYLASSSSSSGSNSSRVSNSNSTTTSTISSFTANKAAHPLAMPSHSSTPHGPPARPSISSATPSAALLNAHPSPVPMSSIPPMSPSQSPNSMDTSSSYSSGTRQAKIIATNNLIVATAGLTSGAQSLNLMMKSTGGARNAAIDPYLPQSGRFHHPQVQDPVVLPLPANWFEQSMRVPSLRKKNTRNDIPLPKWKELTDHDLQLDDNPTEADYDEPSDEKVLAYHKEFEKDEKKILRLFLT